MHHLKELNRFLFPTLSVLEWRKLICVLVAISPIRLPGFLSNALDKSSAYQGPPGFPRDLLSIFSGGSPRGEGAGKILTPADPGTRQFGSYLARNLTPGMEKKGKKRKDERYRRI
ncbi:hypothetical protein CEXT_53251 [Caerostris extrusa]|uniref:Uncharacterized protein n=1 Tax=Caerostris extrusa TaxID=172846 RepID=A0AAV4XBQ0_CAEEX|nr:hypothetical protein CEXT_53251 [Caerostris extrusa]